MERVKNIEAYIENKIQKEMSKNLIGIIDKRIQQLNLNTISTRYQRSTVNDFSRNALNLGINHLMSFSTSNSQLVNTFAEEIRRALIKSV